MAINLLTAVQEKMGYTALQKIDPNTQQVTDTNKEFTTQNSFAQAAVPAVLIAFYYYSRSNDNALNMLNNTTNDNWISDLFGEDKLAVVNSIAGYSNYLPEAAELEMNEIALTTLQTIKENLPESNVDSLQNYLHSQQQNNLTYLPASIQLGKLISHNNIDDATQKMEGPVSSLIQHIGAAFSGDTVVKVPDENISS